MTERDLAVLHRAGDGERLRVGGIGVRAATGELRTGLGERADLVASNVIRQCRTSGILTTETRTTERRFAAAGFAQFDAAVARGLLRPVAPQVCHALFAGPIAALVQMREAGELEVTDAVLRATFDGVCRSLLAASGVPES